VSPVITGIERRRRGVVAVTVDDGEEPSLLPVEAIIEHALHEGSVLPAPDWETLRVHGRRRLAVRRSLEILSRRQRTEAELRSTLARDFAAEEIDHAVARLRELRYLDDEAWATSYVASLRSETRGSSLLKQELRRHGVPGELAERVVEEHDDLEAALAAARRRLGSLGRLDEEKMRRRLYDFLRRRGFDHGIAQLVVARLTAGERPAAAG
jgi:regulatory protein